MGTKKNLSFEMSILGRKWAVNIISDLFFGITRFGGFLEKNPGISTRMLSLRLKELERFGLVSKSVSMKNPSKTEYALTQKGKELNKIIYEISMHNFRNSNSKPDLKEEVMMQCYLSRTFKR